MNLILLHGQPSILVILVALLVIGFAVGVCCSLIYAFIIMFYPDKKVNTKNVIYIIGATTIMALFYFVLMLI